jgi:superfamily II DNA or RNA helicase
MITKDSLQADVVNKFLALKKGYFLAIGGVGKTITAVKTILALGCPITHVVVPQIVLKEQWEKVLTDWGVTNTTVYVINSYISTSMECEFLILDEIHRLVGENALLFNRCLHDSKYNYFLGLTATIDKDIKATLHSKEIFLIREVTLREAIANNWVSPVIEYNIFLELTEWEKQDYYEVDKKCKYYFRTFNNNFESVNRILKDKEFRVEYALSKRLEESILFAHATQFFSSIKKRKDIINSAYNKYLKTVELCERHKGEKIIIFAESNTFSKNLQTLLQGSELYNSTITSKKRKEVILNGFLYGSTDILIGSKSLDAGFDAPKVTVGIICSGTGSDKQHRQRLYRLSRFVEDKQATLYNLIVANSQEENTVIRKQKYSKAIEIK